MDMNPVDSAILQSVQKEQNIEAQYAVKLIKMAPVTGITIAGLESL